MGIFDSYLEEANLSNEEVLAEALSLMTDAYLESEDEIDWMYENYAMQALEEGANIDMVKIYRQLLKDYRAEFKVFKKAYRSKDFDGALDSISKLKKILADAESNIRGVDANNVTSLVCSILASFGYAILTMFVGVGLDAATAYNFYKGTGMFAKELGKASAAATVKMEAPMAGLVIIFKQMVTLARSIKEYKSGSTKNPKEAFNMLRTDLLSAIKQTNKALDKLAESIRKRKAKKEEKEAAK